MQENSSKKKLRKEVNSKNVSCGLVFTILSQNESKLAETYSKVDKVQQMSDALLAVFMMWKMYNSL